MSYSQSLSPQIIASSGGFYSNGNNSLSWTLGEPVIHTGETMDIILTQGFQQSNYIISLVEDNSKKYFAKIFPNPTQGNFTIESIYQTNLLINIIDTSGHVLSSSQFDTLTQVDISNFPNGIYYIQLLNNKKYLIETFSIQKFN